MSTREAIRTVPLEAGIGPDNPPCPVCEEPLFGWATLPLSEVPVRRCETCGMGVAGDPPGRAEVARLVAQGGRALPNRRSLVASLGTSGWAGIERSRKVMLTREVVARVGGRAKARPSFGLAIQTIFNSFTFGHNLVLARFRGAEATPAREPWQRRLDTAITVLSSPVVVVAAVLVELAGWAVGRGGVLTIEPGASSEPASD